MLVGLEYQFDPVESFGGHHGQPAVLAEWDVGLLADRGSTAPQSASTRRYRRPAGVGKDDCVHSEKGHAAVVVPVPAAEQLVSTWREQFDRSAAQGMPAHITALYPFLPRTF